jgi:hypothetical protein
MTNWPEVGVAVVMLIATVAVRKLIFYVEDRRKARRLMKIVLHRVMTRSQRALDHEERLRKRCRRLIRLLK